MGTGQIYSMSKESKLNPLSSHQTIKSQTAILRDPTSIMSGIFHGIRSENSLFPSIASSEGSQIQNSRTSDDLSHVRSNGRLGSRVSNPAGSPFISTFDPDPTAMEGNHSTSEWLRPTSSQDHRDMSIGSMSGLDRPYGSSYGRSDPEDSHFQTSHGAAHSTTNSPSKTIGKILHQNSELGERKDYDGRINTPSAQR